MSEFYVIISLFGYASGAYAFAFAVYKSLQNHKNDYDVHKTNEYVHQDVCSERIRRIDDSFKGLRNQINALKENDIKEIKETLNWLRNHKSN